MMTTRPIVLISFLFALTAHAQMDPSSALLLRSGSKTPAADQLDSGRYTVKPSVERDTEPVRPPRVRDAVVTEKPAVKKPVEETPAPVAPAPVAEPAAAVGPVVAPAVAAPVNEVSKGRSVTGQVQDLLMGGSPEEMDTYRGQLSPDDVRNNLVEIDIAPTYIYNQSRSNYWFHDFRTASPGVLVGAKVWLTPFFAINTTFHNSLQADVLGAPGTVNYISVDHSWFSAGVRMRKFFGLGRRSPSLSLGLDYAEYQMHVPPESTQRIRTKTSGPSLSVEATMPRSAGFSWVLGGFIIPHATFKERATAVTVKSGTRSETTVVGASFGGLFTFDRQNQVFWKAEVSVERRLFTGDASIADPATGNTPKGVSITDSFSIFQIGYRWGN